MKSQESVAELLAKLTLLHSNLTEFMNKFAQSLTSYSNYTEVIQQAEDGSTSTIKIPSMGYMGMQVTALNNQIETLVSANDKELILKYTDGSVRSFEMKALSTLIDTLESIKDAQFTIPSEFRVKNNWFFESFLNPLIYVTINIQSFLTDNNVNKFAVKRIIANTISDADNSFFDSNIKGRTDIVYEDLLTALDNEGIVYTEDDNIVDLPYAINRYQGSFSVIKITDEDVVVDGVTMKQKHYKLDVLTYVDILNGNNSTKLIDIGDVLITSNDTEFRVVSIDRNTNSVLLEKIFGTDSIAIGTNILRIRPLAYRIPELQINVGFNERQVIFVKPISRTLDLTVNTWSMGFGIFTNELLITLTSGDQIDLSSYYNNFVSDFGMMFLSMAKEKQVPAALGVTPDAPLLDAANFEVKRINSHLKEDKSVDDLRQKIATKEKLENEVAEINKDINTQKLKLNDSNTVSDAERLKIKKSIDEDVAKKNSSLTQLSTTISEITLDIKTNVGFRTTPKYRVRGFWNIPDPKTTTHGNQTIIQFVVSYRYISKKGNANNVNQITYVNAAGAQEMGFFSNWVEVVSPIRKKEYDENSGIYIWSAENTADPDVVNINQLDIPISSGESVEIRVKSISEAGYPINPLSSDWSTSVIIPFPDDLEATEEETQIAQRMQLDEVSVKFQEELNARGLDIHLLNSVVTGDKYYGHKAEDIASGYFTPEGKIIDLFVKLKSMEDRLTAIENAITKDKGLIKVSLVDEVGNVTEIKQGTTLSLFAGFYKDLVTEGTTINHGNIVTKTYILSIQNTSQTPLELASRIAGGIDQKVPDHNPVGVEDYDLNRIYDKTPIMPITLMEATTDGAFKQRAPFQSANVRSQFVYNRYVDYGLTNYLYASPDIINPAYAYQGKTVGSELVPVNYGHYLPFDPTWIAVWTTPDANVWNGTIDAGGAIGTNGPLSTFCIHKDHPDVKAITTFPYTINTVDLFRPDGLGKQGYYKFAHGLHFETSKVEDVNAFGVSYYKQVEYTQPTGTSTGAGRRDDAYPLKAGFSVNDSYLIGKYTCGSYLFMGPSKYEDISIEGNHPRLAKKTINVGNENAINIPIVFQFRCSDTIGKIGGWRPGNELTNITYTKKIGLDIYERLNTTQLSADYGDVFSFDIEVSCKYAKDTPVISPLNIPAEGSLNVQSINFKVE